MTSTESPDIMLYGTAAHGLKDGTESSKDWAGRGILEKAQDDGQWKFRFYQVYLVSRIHTVPFNLLPEVLDTEC